MAAASEADGRIIPDLHELVDIANGLALRSRGLGYRRQDANSAKKQAEESPIHYESGFRQDGNFSYVQFSDLHYHRHDHRPASGCLLNKPLQLDAYLFLDHTVVSFLF